MKSKHHSLRYSCDRNYRRFNRAYSRNNDTRIRDEGDSWCFLRVESKRKQGVHGTCAFEQVSIIPGYSQNPFTAAFSLNPRQLLPAKARITKLTYASSCCTHPSHPGRLPLTPTLSLFARSLLALPASGARGDDNYRRASQPVGIERQLNP